jgi:hypothetical protein
MFMNLEFSGDYSDCQRFESPAVCCYSNTGSAKVLLEQQSSRSQCSAELGGML